MFATPLYALVAAVASSVFHRPLKSRGVVEQVDNEDALMTGNDLARDPIWEDRLFAADNNGNTNNGGVLISYDGGNLWNVLPLGWTSSISVVPK